MIVQATKSTVAVILVDNLVETMVVEGLVAIKVVSQVETWVAETMADSLVAIWVTMVVATIVLAETWVVATIVLADSLEAMLDTVLQVDVLTVA